jgi:hypothetical protein
MSTVRPAWTTQVRAGRRAGLGDGHGAPLSRDRRGSHIYVGDLIPFDDVAGDGHVNAGGDNAVGQERTLQSEGPGGTTDDSAPKAGRQPQSGLAENPRFPA